MYHPAVRSRARPGLLALGACAASCGGDAIRVQLAPIEVAGSTCGRAADGRKLLVTALGDFAATSRAVALDAPIAIGDFPVDTRQLTIEMLGDNGAVRAIGKTAPLVLGDLGDGAVVPIMMAPPEGFCPVGPLAAARDRPLIVRLGPGALVLGGRDDAGAVRTAEYYDPATGQFSAVTVPSVYGTALGFTGAAATAMPDGRAVISGGPSSAFAVFDPKTREVQLPGTLGQVRAYHAAVALDNDRIELIGGCSLLNQASGACEPGSADPTTARIVAIKTGDFADGPRPARARLDGTALLEPAGAELGDPRRVLVVGGVDATGAPVASIERADPVDAAPATAAPGPPGVVAALAGGAIVVGFAPAGAPAAGATAVIAPAADPTAVASAPARADAALVPLEDGGVLALGDGPPARYAPARARWAAIPFAGDGPVGLTGHGAVRLDDGTVLVVGGHDASGRASAGAWIYRPALIGPFAGAATATPAVADADAPLDPLDPALVTIDSTGWALAGRGPGLGAWVIVTGPTFVDGTLAATVRPTGGFAALVGFVAPDRFDAVILTPGAAARLDRHRGAITTPCTGSVVDAAIGGGDPVTVTIVRAAGRVTASVGGRPVLTCALPDGERGAFGLGPLGPAALGVAIVSVSH
jgi:hypothetical protein